MLTGGKRGASPENVIMPVTVAAVAGSTVTISPTGAASPPDWPPCWPLVLAS